MNNIHVVPSPFESFGRGRGEGNTQCALTSILALWVPEGEEVRTSLTVIIICFLYSS
jgi:hypothetical protein